MISFGSHWPRCSICRVWARTGWFVVAMLVAWFSFASADEQTSENTPRLKAILEKFPHADLNGDGILTDAEVRQVRENLQKKRGGKGAPREAVPTPTFANVSYGPHERNVLDFWKAESSEPTALIVFIHGGGFVGGDKSKADSAMIRNCLKAGVSFMAINYRFRKHAPIQDILRDAARAIQFMRYHAKEYNIDPTRIACYGGSAGAGTSLWLAVHDDLADPNSQAPVLRESSRISAAGCQNGQATYDLTEWEQLIGPMKEEWWQTPNEKIEFYHFKSEADLQTPEGKKVLADCSMIRQITGGDPPIFMSCNLPDQDPQNRGQYVHHPRHVHAVKKQCEAVGVECVTVLRDDPQNRSNNLLDFLLKSLTVKPPQAKDKGP